MEIKRSRSLKQYVDLLYSFNVLISYVLLLKQFGKK